MEERRPTAPLKILLEGQPNETCPMLNQEQQAKLPPKIRDMLSREGVREDLGDMGIVVRVREMQCHEPLKRALQWIAKGAAADFLVSRLLRLDVITKKGVQRVIVFEPKNHANNAGYTAAKTTRSNFLEEIDLYKYSIDYGLVDLQQHMSKKIRSYPVYASEIAMLINGLYSTHNRFTEHVDPELANFIAERIQCFRHTLIADSGVLTALRDCIPPKMELEHLSRHASISSKTVDAALHALRGGISEPKTAETLLQIFERNHLNPTTSPSRSPGVPVRPAHARRNSSNPLYDSTADAVATLHTIGERRVVRAEQDGRGTLRWNNHRRSSVPPTVRNEEFHVARGQYLVLLPGQRSQVHGANARVVCNDSGDVGELFENLRLTPIQDAQIPPPSPQRGDNSKRARY